MKLTAILPVRSEEWVLCLTLPALLRWCDEVVVLNHNSTDGTGHILEAGRLWTNRIHVLEDNDFGWPEMDHRQWLLDAARQRDASHIVMIDADEILCGNRLPRIRNQAEALGPGEVLRVPLYNMWTDLHRYRSDTCVWTGGICSLIFRDAPELEYRPHHHYGSEQHHWREPKGVAGGRIVGTWGTDGGVMHLQFLDKRRLRAKHALYKMRDRLETKLTVSQINNQYDQAFRESGLQATETPTSWWEPYADLIPYLQLGETPWQEAECRRLWEENGADSFKGLDLFGVPASVTL